MMNDEMQVLGPEEVSISVIESQTRGEMATLIDLAKRYPRNAIKARDTAIDLATMDEETAKGCFYNIPRGGKEIEGPSARLAEIVAGTWGNCRCAARVIDTTRTHVVAQGVFVDLQTNLAYSIEGRRKIVDRNGNRFSEDMITVTANALCSIVLRNAVFKGVPQGVWKPAWDAAKKAAIGDAKTLVSRRTAALAHFAKMGKHEPAVLAFLGVEKSEEITGEMVLKLLGLATAIKDGDISVDEAFSGGDEGAGTKKQAESVNAALNIEKPKRGRPRKSEKEPSEADTGPTGDEPPPPPPDTSEATVAPPQADTGAYQGEKDAAELVAKIKAIAALAKFKTTTWKKILDELGYDDESWAEKVDLTDARIALRALQEG